MQQQQSWRATCNNISGVDVSFFTKPDNMLQLANITLLQNITRGTCCQNSHTLISVFSGEQFGKVKGSLLIDAVSICHFTDTLTGRCNEYSGQQENQKFCNYNGLVFKKYSKVTCFSNEIVRNTCNPRYNCL